MPDVAVAKAQCPMCQVDQPAAEAYTLQCVRCKRMGMMCCVWATVSGTWFEGGSIMHSEQALCLTCKAKESTDA